MKKQSLATLLLTLLALGAFVMNALPVQAAPPELPSADSPAQAGTPPADTERPLVLISTYTADDDVRPGSDFNLSMILNNAGQNNAINIIVSFAPGDLIPRETGGTVTVYQLASGESKGINQPMTASSSLTSGGVASTAITISYTDQSNGASYSASFTASFHIGSPRSSSGPARPTATPTAILKPQLVISRYNTDVDPLQPGSRFKLDLDIINLGTTDARSVTMIVGGGAVPSGEGTPVPGTSGTGGDFSTFAPLNSSNVEFIGDIATAAKVTSSKDLIVNVTANPGAYSLKFSFIYTDPKGVRYVDDQVITLLVYSLPAVDISFYRPPDPFFVGQPGVLPIQVYNVGRKQAILGSLRATVPEGGQVMNNSLLVGVLDPGMYNTLDAQIIPERPGPLDIQMVINYNDDFNQPRTIEQTLTIDVMEMMVEPPPVEGMEGGGNGVPIDVPVVTEETFWQKVLRFLKGLIGLDSGTNTNTPPGIEPGMEGPSEQVPAKPIIRPSKG